ncbi:MAG: hypothetical protein AAF438_22535 [Pseudomonadota bacterium]
MKTIRFEFILAVFFASPVSASETVTLEPDGSSYHFVSHYSIVINGSASAVWDHLVDLGAWMYEFDLVLESGAAGQAGEVRRLYDGQDFFIEITKVIPNELLVLANLPSTFNGEDSTGVVVVLLHERDEKTTVSLTMSRRYSGSGKEPNPQRSMRESLEFQAGTRAMWNDRFLPKLKSLVES